MDIRGHRASSGQNAVDDALKESEVLIFSDDFEDWFPTIDHVTVIQSVYLQITWVMGKTLDDGDRFIDSTQHRFVMSLKPLFFNDVPWGVFQNNLTAFEKVIGRIVTIFDSRIEFECLVADSTYFALFFFFDLNRLGHIIFHRFLRRSPNRLCSL